MKRLGEPKESVVYVTWDVGTLRIRVGTTGNGVVGIHVTRYRPWAWCGRPPVPATARWLRFLLERPVRMVWVHSKSIYFEAVP